jgi:sugar phosphate isomerase/epimerase
VRIRDDLHLTYCTNIHAADGWDAVLANVRTYAPALKARLSPAAPFGVGLRLSAREARELLQGDRLRAFRSYLDGEGLYVALINGFPYGPFHGTPVKANVYAPDWRDDARVEYTLDLIRILAALVPDDVDGGVSTAPLSYKPWMTADDDQGWRTVARNVARVGEALARLRSDSGTNIHLDIEPEPDCSIENTSEALAFFDGWLLRDGAAALSARMRVNEDEARRLLLDHVRLCFDCCHFAVEYEDPAVALQQLSTAGLKIGRVQLSSALKVAFPADDASVRRASDALLPFADTTYLHQVVQRGGGCRGLCRYPDLDDALRRADAQSSEWRIHFHVPLFARDYESFGSTQDYVKQVIDLALASRFTRHLEIETYTWDVLPSGLKLDLLESIAREYEWVLAVVSR